MKKLSSTAFCALVITLAVSLAAALGQSNSSSKNAAASQAKAEPSNQTVGQGSALSQRGQERISKEVRHQLVLLPFYSVFDNLAYHVSPDGTVTLIGQVVNATLKSDAENAVKHIEGVEKVVNNIQVLPPSPNDDRIRRATYRAIYGNEVLSQYELRAVPPIHIIVNNGHLTLEGVVSRQMDKQIAEMQAKSVPGVFSVTDNLKVENQ